MAGAALIVPTLETPRLILRGWTEADFEPFAAMMAHPDVARFSSLDGRPQKPDQSWRIMAMMIGHWALRGFGHFVIAERETRRFVGRAGVWSPEGWIGVELGWTLAREVWGRGFATEAARAAGDWAFAQLQIDAIVSLIHVDNLRSQNVAQRLGERPRSATMHAGQPHTIWAASHAEWRLTASRPPAEPSRSSG